MSDFNATPRRRNSKNFVPELVVAGLIFAGGAWFWSQNLAPQTPLSPEVAAQPIQAPAENWKDAPDDEKEAAQKIIVAQLDAFKADDWDKAVTYQSADLKRSFASTEQFKRVIKENYPEFASYKTVKFGKARIDGAMLQIQVSLTGENGKQIAALYSMAKEPIEADAKDKNKKAAPKTEYRVAGVSGGEAIATDSRTV